MIVRRTFSLTTGLLLSATIYAHGGHEIVAMNPQLSQIPDWPKQSSNTGSVGLPEDCNRCARQDSVANMQRQGETAYRCLMYEGTFGGKAWESGGGETKQFTLQLHPNSPKVWRVFPNGGYQTIAEKNLIAEFDLNGKMTFSKSARSPRVSEPKGEQSNDCQGGRPVKGGVTGQQAAKSGVAPVDPAQAPQKSVQDAAKALKGLLGR